MDISVVRVCHLPAAKIQQTTTVESQPAFAIFFISNVWHFIVRNHRERFLGQRFIAAGVGSRTPRNLRNEHNILDSPHHSKHRLFVSSRTHNPFHSETTAWFLTAPPPRGICGSRVQMARGVLRKNRPAPIRVCPGSISIPRVYSGCALTPSEAPLPRLPPPAHVHLPHATAVAPRIRLHQERSNDDYRLSTTGCQTKSRSSTLLLSASLLSATHLF